MKKIGFLLSMMLMMACFTVANAQTQHPIDKKKAECFKTHKSPLGIIECETVAYNEWSAEIERLYKELQSRLDDDARATLKEEQFKWMELRDLNLELEQKLYAKSTSGSNALVFLASSKTDFARSRALQLQTYLDLLKK